MKLGPPLILAALLIWGGAVAQTTARSQSTPQATPASLEPSREASPERSRGESRSEYLGSDSCARCHEPEHTQWARSLHVQMTKPVAEATIVGDFSGRARLDDHGRAFEFDTRDGRPLMRIRFGDAPPETYGVDYTLGAKRYQGYLSRLEDGRLYVLPAFWHVPTKRWVDWKEITPIPDGAHDLRQVWNVNCFNCHATDLVQGYDVEAARYDTRWTEMGIGCEACHGPGRPHVALMEAWEADPASVPDYDKSASNRDLSGILRIFSPRASGPRPVFDTCSYCHGNKKNYFTGFAAGERYEDYALPFFISEPLPDFDFQGEFWPDGRPNRFNRPQALMLSGCFKAGEVTCTNCHVAHGSRHPFSLKLDITRGTQGDLLCTQCHAEPAAGSRAVRAIADQMIWQPEALERHTFHPAASEGSRCISCHMSDVNWRLLIRRRDHTFKAPVPEITAAFGVPNACTTCHDDKPPEWAVRQMDAWWGDGARRADETQVADTMYRAGSGDTTVLQRLLELAVDRSRGAIVRASAVEFVSQFLLGETAVPAGQSQTSFGYAGGAQERRRVRPPVVLRPEQVNALIGAAADPEPMVRAIAVKALGATGDRSDRVLAAVLSRLVDEARTVRARAAEVLLSFNVAELPGRAGEALARAQDEYVESMRMFPDIAANHASLGWLEAERGNTDEAMAAFDRAVGLDPQAVRPWVLKGIVAARLERYDEAIAHWQQAQKIDRTYPNLDRLIAEAEKRRK